MAVSRVQVQLRPAVVDDADFLAELWRDFCRRADRSEQTADIEVLVKTAEDSPEQRLLVAEREGERIGAVLLKLSTIYPMNPEPCVLVLAPTVVPGARRHGVGRLLLEAAVHFGEELGVEHVGTAVESTARDANRFMARLGFGPRATLRVAPLATVQAKVAASAPGGRGPTRRQLGEVLAARRSMRRPSAAPPA